MRAIITPCVVGFLLLGAASAWSDTREDAVRMVDAVITKIESSGAEPTFAEVTAKKFNSGDLYPFIYNMDLIEMAHGANPALVGTPQANIKDPGGKYLAREMKEIALSAGSGWVEYQWPHPTTGKIARKTTFVKRTGAFIVGVGFYP